MPIGDQLAQLTRFGLFKTVWLALFYFTGAEDLNTNAAGRRGFPWTGRDTRGRPNRRQNRYLGTAARVL